MRSRTYLGVILAGSVALRIWLAARGGQMWWPDEHRFAASQDAVHEALGGHWHAALVDLCGSSDHIGFKFLGLLPALAIAAGFPLWTAAAFFGLFSVGSIALVAKIARFCTDDEAAGTWAAFFAAISVGLFYFSRHLFPYDPALFFGLYALWAGIQDDRPRSPFAAGIWAGLGFLTYNGYWLYCGVSLLVAVCWPARRWRPLIVRAAVGLAALCIPIVVAAALERAAGANPIRGALTFARTVNFGDFREGWTFVWEYLWRTEGWLLPVWFFGAIAGVLAPAVRRYCLVWLGAIAGIWVGLGLLSATFHVFVIYGRIARCVEPFFALICGAGMAQLPRLGERGRCLGTIAAIALVLVAALHFAVPLRQWFPEDMVRYGRRMQAGTTDRIRAINAYSMYNPVFVGPTPFADTILTRPHPLQYEPFLYENLRPEQREFFRRHDLAMRLVRLHPDAPGRVGIANSPFGDYPGAIRISFQPPRGGDGNHPLIATGTARAGDFLVLRRLGPNRFEVSFSDWARWQVTSPPIVLDESHDHVLEISLGSLFPADDHAVYSLHSDWRQLRHRLYVAIDGQTVFDRGGEFFPALPQEIDLGFGLFGGGATEVYFGGRILETTSISPDAIIERIRS